MEQKWIADAPRVDTSQCKLVSFRLLGTLLLNCKDETQAELFGAPQKQTDASLIGLTPRLEFPDVRFASFSFFLSERRDVKSSEIDPPFLNKKKALNVLFPCLFFSPSPKVESST